MRDVGLLGHARRYLTASRLELRMASRAATSKSLSAIEIERLTVDLAAGRKPRVWFTTDAVGIDVGRSGTLVAIADHVEPDFLRVKPSVCTDVLAFSPSELTLTRPAERRVSAPHPTDPAGDRACGSAPGSARRSG
ncbi:hypothetical protein KHQ06_33390 [Nocardia tengchongensis]|uniref:Uncharacterized protein n=1 Tax=Nocardia tengchongensis TaxID=2055889 RepID=A0ABX8CNE9_9NOCA|nr:hypothetical protein [Nocardia tengchongensis]QVI20922.1 hypothetical protein KHQ06_33390 [Nocardia tengchongensis]